MLALYPAWPSSPISSLSLIWKLMLHGAHLLLQAYHHFHETTKCGCRYSVTSPRPFLWRRQRFERMTQREEISLNQWQREQLPERISQLSRPWTCVPWYQNFQTSHISSTHTSAVITSPTPMCIYKINGRNLFSVWFIEFKRQKGEVRWA